MNPTRLAVIAATLMVVGGVVWGFVVLGNPGQARERRYDIVRVSDLQAIAVAITERYGASSSTHELLPSSLPANFAAQRMIDGASALRDPQTQLPYRFIKLRADTYKLCATFVSVSDLGQDPNGWSHPSGQVCYDLRLVNPMPYATEPALSR